MNDTERSQWVDNNEYLYTWKQKSRLSMRNFIRKNKAAIDHVINLAIARSPQPPFGYGSL